MQLTPDGTLTIGAEEIKSFNVGNEHWLHIEVAVDLTNLDPRQLSIPAATVARHIPPPPIA